VTASYEQIIGGRYALYGPIASGGMAAVHFGRLLGTGGFARTVAIKRLRGEFLDKPEVITTLLDEARLASRIRHPNVVPTLDMVAGEDEVFLVMEYVAGETLGRLLKAAQERGERTSPRIATGIMTSVLYGLHAAHEATDERGEPMSIVHRDVSPQNVLVGADGLARLLDFGIAKGKGRLQTTRAGQLKGKVSYMSPEQILGDEPDRRSDVYAAAVVLWETLTGRRLFPSGETVAQSYDAIPRILEADVDPPSVVAPGVPEELDAIVMRGLNRHRETRWETARDFAVALEDAVGVATTRQIGEWVEHLAAETLTEREAMLRELEAQLPIGDRHSVGDIVDATVNRRRRKKLSEEKRKGADEAAVMADKVRASKDKKAPGGSLRKRRIEAVVDGESSAEGVDLHKTLADGKDTQDQSEEHEGDEVAVTRVDRGADAAVTRIDRGGGAAEGTPSGDGLSGSGSGAGLSSSGRRDVELARRIDARDREQAQAFAQAKELAKRRAQGDERNTPAPPSFDDAVQLPVQSNRAILVAVVAVVVIAIVVLVAKLV